MHDGNGRVESINAVTLVTTRMASAVAFYEALGFRVLYWGREADFTTLAAGPCSSTCSGSTGGLAQPRCGDGSSSTSTTSTPCMSGPSPPV